MRPSYVALYSSVLPLSAAVCDLHRVLHFMTSSRRHAFPPPLGSHLCLPPQAKRIPLYLVVGGTWGAAIAFFRSRSTHPHVRSSLGNLAQECCPGRCHQHACHTLAHTISTAFASIPAYGVVQTSTHV